MNKISFNEHYGLQSAVINGTKTMTRRLERCLDKLLAADNSKGGRLKILQQEITREGIVLLTDAGIISLHTRYKIDEVVAVAQAYRDCNNNREMRFDDYFGTPGWDNKMFVCADLMPHQICITRIRVERLQDISDDDCVMEGVRYIETECLKKGKYYISDNEGYETERQAFAALIDKVSRKGTWERNPWVVVYSFKLVK